MKKFLFSLLIAAIAFGCNNTASRKENTTKDQAAPLRLLSDKEKAFIMEFVSQQGEQVYVVTTVRNRYFTKKDASQITAYFTNAEHPEYINEFVIERGEEKLVDTSGTHERINWVDDNDIHTCRTILRDL